MNFRFAALLLVTFSSSLLFGSTSGCRDPLATNYDSQATINDGSCLYPLDTVYPVTAIVLDSLAHETSGLIVWNGSIWTQNDDNDTAIHSLDTISGNVQQTLPLTGVVNYDWEEISQDDSYIYIGDFGNNSAGNRTDLHVLRVEKNSLINGFPVIDTIAFSYSNQTNFTASGATDFDCEAMVVSDDSIFLFTKQWVSKQTTLYGFPKIPGTWIADSLTTYNVSGLITGATYVKDKAIVVLTGYNVSFFPFIYLLYDFEGTHFLSGNKRRLATALPYHQTEGVATFDGLNYYISCEQFYHSPIFIDAQLMKFEFSQYLSAYISSLNNIPDENPPTLFEITHLTKNEIEVIYPSSFDGKFYSIFDMSGKLIATGKLQEKSTLINMTGIAEGNYLFNVDGKTVKFIR